jgi:hypothetical protein
MRVALVVGLAFAALALLPGAAQAKNCGRKALGEGSGTSSARVITRNLSCKRGTSILDRWYAKADTVCAGGACPVIRISGYRCTQSKTKPRARCVKGKRVARAEFGL